MEEEDSVAPRGLNVECKEKLDGLTIRSNWNRMPPT